MRKHVLSIVMLLLFIDKAEAYPKYSVGSLYQECNGASVSEMNRAKCYGSLIGAAKGLLAQNRFCVKGDFKMETLVQSFLDWAGENPDKWGISDADGVAAAFERTWPCGASQ